MRSGGVHGEQREAECGLIQTEHSARRYILCTTSIAVLGLRQACHLAWPSISDTHEPVRNSTVEVDTLSRGEVRSLIPRWAEHASMGQREPGRGEKYTVPYRTVCAYEAPESGT